MGARPGRRADERCGSHDEQHPAVQPDQSDLTMFHQLEHRRAPLRERPPPGGSPGFNSAGVVRQSRWLDGRLWMEREGCARRRTGQGVGDGQPEGSGEGWLEGCGEGRWQGQPGEGGGRASAEGRAGGGRPGKEARKARQGQKARWGRRPDGGRPGRGRRPGGGRAGRSNQPGGRPGRQKQTTGAVGQAGQDRRGEQSAERGREAVGQTASRALTSRPTRRSRPPKPWISSTTDTPVTTPPARSTSSHAAAAVPPVASTSSTTTTR